MKAKINWSFPDPSALAGTHEEKLQQTRLTSSTHQGCSAAIHHPVSVSMMQRYLSEGIGTFAIVFFGCGAIVIDQLSGEPSRI
jgi:hypothetical protein